MQQIKVASFFDYIFFNWKNFIMKTKTVISQGVNNYCFTKHKLNTKTNTKSNYLCLKNILICQETNVVFNHPNNFYMQGFYKEYDDC